MKKKTPKKSKNKPTPMERLTANYERLIEGREQVENGEKAFAKALKQSVRQNKGPGID